MTFMMKRIHCVPSIWRRYSCQHWPWLCSQFMHMHCRLMNPNLYYPTTTGIPQMNWLINVLIQAKRTGTCTSAPKSICSIKRLWSNGYKANSLQGQTPATNCGKHLYSDDTNICKTKNPDSNLPDKEWLSLFWNLGIRILGPPLPFRTFILLIGILKSSVGRDTVRKFWKARTVWESERRRKLHIGLIVVKVIKMQTV